ncbi:MAG: Lrp/AsnC family transcriptional regulator, partial [Clostridia bacterium]|nr:Lrp/AsnC family transcriptional regulator [Clostridia bacterium]
MTINWNAKEAAAVVALQRGIQYVARPFAVIGDACGMTEAEVLALAQQLMDSGDARRFGSVFDARRLGYRSALCA